MRRLSDGSPQGDCSIEREMEKRLLSGPPCSSSTGVHDCGFNVGDAWLTVCYTATVNVQDKWWFYHGGMCNDLSHVDSGVSPHICLIFSSFQIRKIWEAAREGGREGGSEWVCGPWGAAQPCDHCYFPDAWIAPRWVSPQLLGLWQVANRRGDRGQLGPFFFMARNVNKSVAWDRAFKDWCLRGTSHHRAPTESSVRCRARTVRTWTSRTPACLVVGWSLGLRLRFNSY